MGLAKSRLFALFVLTLLSTGCFRYSFTGISIPQGVQTVFIGFFPDQSSSGLAILSDALNEELVNQFVNQSRLQLSRSEDAADAVVSGQIVRYVNKPTQVGSDGVALQHDITVVVKATFKYASEEEPEWTKNVESTAQYNPNEDPVNGEANAARQALEIIARNIFNDALSSW